MGKGKVYLVGAGPGDPKLITVRGLEVLRRSDAVVYDRLAGTRILKEIRDDAERIYVGKLPDRHTVKQEEINRLLVELASRGKIVTRLKGGDPSVFGRVGEEAEELLKHGIDYEIVPGVTSAVAVPMYAGIPVSHRDFASSFSVITGHESPDKLDTHINWEKLSMATDTLIFLMGVAKLDYISSQLIRWGRPPSTPTALVRWGTRVEQQTLVGTLETIAAQVKETGFKPPAVIVVGEVVELRRKLSWFETKPLFGKRILVTRAREQASQLAAAIEELGGEPLSLPSIRTRWPSRPEALDKLDRSLRSLREFDWVMFTSVNGVDYFFERLALLELDIRSLGRARIAAVGPKTAEALRRRGLRTEALPAEYQAEGMLASLLPHLKQGQRALLPRANIARSYLPEALRKLGLEAVEADVYETVISDEDAAEATGLLREGKIHAITFTSSSTATNFWELLKRQEAENPHDLLRGVRIVCIGPKTAETAAKLGMRVSRVAEQATIESLVQALKDDEI